MAKDKLDMWIMQNRYGTRMRLDKFPLTMKFVLDKIRYNDNQKWKETIRKTTYPQDTILIEEDEFQKCRQEVKIKDDDQFSVKIDDFSILFTTYGRLWHGAKEKIDELHAEISAIPIEQKNPVRYVQKKTAGWIGTPVGTVWISTDTVGGNFIQPENPELRDTPLGIDIDLIDINDFIQLFSKEESNSIKAVNRAERDWKSDFSDENGNYINMCISCKQEFTGHKRRVVCRACTLKDLPEIPAVKF